MPVKVKCTNCDKVLSAPDAARGKAIKCPECQTRIAVPGEPASSKPAAKAASSKGKVKKSAKPVDSETALANFDMRRAEDTQARICSKCGYDMKYQDEEETECPQCGYDADAGGLGVKAKKRAMKGPDPDDFYPDLIKQSWKFVGRNQFLAWRTIGYTMVCLLISMFCAFMYLWIPMWPPRIFIGLCFTISFLVIPGWMWFLDTEVIKLTLERKDKFKKLNFDFFLASAMGAAFIFWSIAVALPVMILPVGLGYYLVNYNGMPFYVLPVCIAIGAIPAIWMLPVVMSHMSMPVQYKGWLIWKVVPMWARNLKPLSYWFLWFLITNSFSIAGITVIGAVYGSEITTIVQIMEDNADIKRKKMAQIDNPNARKKGQAAPVVVVLPDPKSVNFIPLIVPALILILMTVVNGFTCMFNMRTNGQFTYYHKASLEMVDKLKEYKYVAKERRDEDEDDIPRTVTQHLVDAFAFIMIFDLLGLVVGMLVGALTNFGMLNGILVGLWIGHVIGMLVVYIQCIIFAFQESLMWGLITLVSLFICFPIGFSVYALQNFEERKGPFIRMCLAFVMAVVIMITITVMGVAESVRSSVNPAPANQQQMVPPNMMPPNMMPGQGAPGGPNAAHQMPAGQMPGQQVPAGQAAPPGQ